MIKEGYTRVSEVIGWCKKHSLGEIDPQVLKNKCDLGTNVHAAIDGYFTGLYVPLNEKEQLYFDSFVKWFEKSGWKLRDKPGRLYCDVLKITGEVDALFLTDDKSDAILVDYKTSYSEDKIGWALQGAFYKELCSANGIYTRNSFSFIKLHKEGKEPKICEYKHSDRLWEMALTCLNAYRIWN